MPKYTIEFDGPNNESYRFAPAATTLRGAWSSFKVAQNDMNEAMKALSTIQRIPGMRVSVDTEARTSRIFDPLAETEEGRLIWEKVLQKIRQHEAFFGNAQKTCKTIEKERMTDSELKTWLYYMAMAVESGYAAAVGDSAPVPSIETIRGLPGGIRLGLLGSNSGYKPEAEKWRDVVPSGGKASGGQGALAAAK